jgi:hypothetical protein
MRLLLIALDLVVLVGAVAGATAAIRSWRERRNADRSPWRLREVSDGELLSVRAERPGEQPLMVGAVPFAAGDFDFRIEELRAEAEVKLAALNSRRSLSR